jgi:glyoxylase-like metal-dependent hydrolase (beta-lactamase superfamily II)
MKEPVIIHRIPVGPYKVNCYLVACPATLQTAIIDPGGDPEMILETLHRQGLIPRYLLNTHAHGDHGLANAALRQTLGLPLGLHPADVNFFAQADNRATHFRELGMAPCGPADLLLRDGQHLPLGRLTIKVLHTPGHSPGSVCYYLPGHLFSGDTLFVGDVGRTDLTGGKLETLLASLRDRILPLPDATIIHPGHDYGETPTSTLAWEKRENPYITDFLVGV